MQTLKALLLSDGRPGHYTLSEGILAAIARRRPVEIERVDVRRPRWLPARALSALWNAGTSPKRILRFVYGIDPATLPQAGLIVSAGGDTLAANIAAAKLRDAPNIFYGSLRRYRETDFTLVMTSYPRHEGRPRHLVTLKPNKRDPDSTAGRRTTDQFQRGTPPQQIGLLIGGNAGTVTFEPADWDRLLRLAKMVADAWGSQWIVATSPRTPPDAADRFSEQAARTGSAIAKFIDYRTAGPGTLAEVFAACPVVLVTSDSSSMLSEAVWMRKPTLSVSPEHAALPADEQDYRRFLEQNGWCAHTSISDLSPAAMMTAFDTLTPLGQNPLDLLASDLAQRLPGLFKTRD